MVEFSVMIALAILAAALLWSEGLTDRRSDRAWALGGILMAVAVRWFVLPYNSTEDAALLMNWAAFFRINGGFAALAGTGCPYPLAVQYLLALFSWVEYPALYLMKYGIFFGEVLLSWGCCRLTGLFTKKKQPRMAAFLLVLLLPAGIVLGGYAAMGESLWCALAVLAAERALANRPWQSMALWALSLCFGLPAIFLLPVFLVLLRRKRLRIYHLLILPVVFAAPVIPALWPDRPIKDILLLLPPFTGLGTQPVFQGAPGLYALGGEPLSPLWGLGVFALLCLVLVWWLATSGKRTRDETLVAALAFTAVAAAMLLPWMGEDSLYAAEVLCLVICLTCRWMIPAAVLCSATSLLACLAAQFGKTPLPLHWGTAVLLAILAALTAYMYNYTYRKKSRSRK